MPNTTAPVWTGYTPKRDTQGGHYVALHAQKQLHSGQVAVDPCPSVQVRRAYVPQLATAMLAAAGVDAHTVQQVQAQLVAAGYLHADGSTAPWVVGGS